MSTQSDPLKTTTQELRPRSINALIVSGCSFTACSSDIRTARQSPETWPHFVLAKNTRLTQFVNLAMPSGGNIAAAQNLLTFLEINPVYTVDRTVILFNITGFDRMDVMCRPDHPNQNPNFSWSNVLQFGWLNSGGFLYSRIGCINKLQKDMGLDLIAQSNALALLSLISYLEMKGYRYAFMVMNDSVLLDCPTWFKNFLDTRHEKHIDFENLNMYEYCKKHSLIHSDNFHPSNEGHSHIADHVYMYGVKNEWF